MRHKDIWLLAHESLVAEYQDRFPGTDWTTAYERTVDSVDGRVADIYAEQIDQARMMAKEGK